MTSTVVRPPFIIVDSVQQPMTDRTIHVVRLTPPGRGAVATLLVTGAGAVAAVDGLFRAGGPRRLGECPADALVIGRFGAAPDGTEKTPGEQIIARRVSSEEVLLHCHGGTAAVARIEGLLAGQGAVPRDWPAWAADAHADPIEAEAVVALAKATTERTAAILLDQYQGALRTRMNEITAAADAGDSRRAVQSLDPLLRRAPLGLHLTEPWNVVLAGPPNSGKSSLVNAMLGYARSIVHVTPGTTRDVLAAETSIDGWPACLLDTAGLRVSDHPVEAEGVRRARQQLETADLVLWVVDASQPPPNQSQPLLEPSRDREGAVRPLPNPSRDREGADRRVTDVPETALVVHNKSDLPRATGDRPDGISTSALTGEGVPQLLRAIADRLVPDPPPPGEPIPFTRRQVDDLAATRAALARP